MKTLYMILILTALMLIGCNTDLTGPANTNPYSGTFAVPSWLNGSWNDNDGGSWTISRYGVYHALTANNTATQVTDSKTVLGMNDNTCQFILSDGTKYTFTFYGYSQKKRVSGLDISGPTIRTYFSLKSVN